MYDPKISALNTLAWTLWAAAIILTALDLGGVLDDWGRAGILAGLGAGTLHLRLVICRMTSALQTAYRAGRDDGRNEMVQAPVQRIR